LSWSGVNTRLISKPRRQGADRRRQGGNAVNADTYGFETRTVHAGPCPTRPRGPGITPIYQTSSFVFDDVDHAASLFNLHNFGYLYSGSAIRPYRCWKNAWRALRTAAPRWPRLRARAQFLTFFTLLERATIPGLAQSLRRIAHPIRPVLQETRRTCHFVDPVDPENFFARP